MSVSIEPFIITNNGAIIIYSFFYRNRKIDMCITVEREN